MSPSFFVSSRVAKVIGGNMNSIRSLLSTMMRPFDGEPDLLEGELDPLEGVDIDLGSLETPAFNTKSLDSPIPFTKRRPTAMESPQPDGSSSSGMYPVTSNM